MRNDTKLDILWEEMGTANNELAAVKAVTDQVSPLIPKIPKDYSTEETDTGVKWIDGRNVYMKAFYGVTPTEDPTLAVGSIEAGSLVIDMCLIGTNTSGTYHEYLPNDLDPRVSSAGNVVISKSASTSYQGTDFTLIIKYVKPASTETKSRKKK